MMATNVGERIKQVDAKYFRNFTQVIECFYGEILRRSQIWHSNCAKMTLQGPRGT